MKLARDNHLGLARNEYDERITNKLKHNFMRMNRKLYEEFSLYQPEVLECMGYSVAVVVEGDEVGYLLYVFF